jgi:hypothetical protein
LPLKGLGDSLPVVRERLRPRQRPQRTSRGLARRSGETGAGQGGVVRLIVEKRRISRDMPAHRRRQQGDAGDV